MLESSIASRAVSLEVVHALHTVLSAAGEYSLPTFNFAVRSICSGPTGEALRFTDILSRQHVGTPSAFVSHMWTAPIGKWPGHNPFLGTSKQILDHYEADSMPAAERGELRVWIDMFAVSQHPGMGQMSDLANLELAVEEASKRDGTLLVLDPKGITLTRIWCLLEIWRTAEHAGASKLHIVSHELDGSELRQVWESLDITSAAATLDEDRVRIMRRFEDSNTPMPALNQVIKDALVQSAQAEAGRVLEGADSVKTAPVLVKCAMMLQHCAADYKKAIELFKRAMSAYEAEAGQNAPVTLSSCNFLALAYKADGSLDEAGPLSRRVWEGREATLGPNHSATLQALNNHALFLLDTGDLDGAEELSRKALEGREAVLGPNHASTLFSGDAHKKLRVGLRLRLCFVQ